MIKFIGQTPLIKSVFPTATIEEALEWCRSNRIIGVDTETIGDCWTGHIYTLQVGNRDIQYVIDATTYDIRIFKDVFEDPEKLILGQNIKYDLKFFLKLGMKPKNIYDTFIAECILTTGKEDRQLGLGYLAKHYCNVDLDKTVRGKIGYAGLTDEVIKYAAEDVLCLEDIMIQQLEKLKYWGLENVTNLENNVTKVFAEIEYNGMKLDPIKWIEQADQREGEAHKYEDNLNGYILGNPERFSMYFDNQLDLFDTSVKLKKINWNSSKQVIEIFAKDEFYTDSVNEKVIEKYRNKFPLVDLYLKYKENQTSISKFGRKYLRWINQHTGRVNTSYWQILATGRVSSGKKKKKKTDLGEETPNMQQLPATNEIRNCFISEEGYSFVDCDYSAMEAAAAGYCSGEESWVEAFQKGLDMHSVVAEAVYKDKWREATEEGCIYVEKKQKCNCKGHKEFRNKTKTLNYLVIFGGGPPKLSDSINISLEEAKATIDGYFKGLPKLSAFLKKLKKFGVDKGYITTKKPYGRIRWFAPHNNDRKAIGQIQRQSANTFIQGSCADITKLAMCKMYEIKELQNWDVKFVLQLHDAVVCEVIDDQAQDWMAIQRHCMIEAFEEVMGHPIDVDGYIAKYWKK